MARFQIQYETTRSGNVKSMAGTSITAETIGQAKQKLLSLHPGVKVRIISCVKIGK
jgi:hypothetical protein